MESLAKIQQALKVPKNQYNKFGGYYYRSLEDIMETVKPLLGKAILIINDELVQIGDRFYVKATATFKEGGESISATAYARESESRKGMDAAQITGSCSSYAGKYALGRLFCLSDGPDPDFMNNSNGGGSPTPSSNDVASPKAAPSPSPAQEEIGQAFDKPEPPKPPDNRPAMGKPERDFMNALRDYYKAQETPHFKVVNAKLADAIWLNLGRWPSSESDCKIAKQYVSFVDVAEKV